MASASVGDDAAIPGVPTDSSAQLLAAGGHRDRGPCLLADDGCHGRRNERSGAPRPRRQVLESKGSPSWTSNVVRSPVWRCGGRSSKGCALDLREEPADAGVLFAEFPARVVVSQSDGDGSPVHPADAAATPGPRGLRPAAGEGGAVARGTTARRRWGVRRWARRTPLDALSQVLDAAEDASPLEAVAAVTAKLFRCAGGVGGVLPDRRHLRAGTGAPLADQRRRHCGTRRGPRRSRRPAAARRR